MSLALVLVCLQKSPVIFRALGLRKSPVACACKRALALAKESCHCKRVLSCAKELCYVQKSPFTRTCKRALCHVHNSAPFQRKRTLSFVEPFNVQKPPFTRTCKRGLCHVHNSAPVKRKRTLLFAAPFYVHKSPVVCRALLFAEPSCLQSPCMCTRALSL